MSNWVVGCLKARGTNNNLIRFLKEGLEYIDYPDRFVETEHLFAIKKLNDTHIEGILFKNVKRHYIHLNDNYVYFIKGESEEEETIIVFKEFRAAWGVDEGGLAKISKEYNVDFKFYGFESYKEYNVDLEIVKGKIAKEDYIKFDDYEWECIFPYLGG